MNLWADPERLGALALLSGWVALDTTEAVQLMVCQPLVAGWLAGCLTGQPELGLAVGGGLQLLWSRLAPIGATAFPDVGPATVAGVAAGAGLLSSSGGATWTGLIPDAGAAPPLLLALLVALLAARVNQEIVVRQRRRNRGLAATADAAALRGSFSGVERANAAGLVGGFLRGLVTVPAALLLGELLHRAGALVVRTLPPPHAALSSLAALPNLGAPLLWAFGFVALALTLLRARRLDWLLFATGIAAGVALAVAR